MVFVSKVFCPEECLSLEMHYRRSTYSISVYKTKERSEVVRQVLSSLSQWPYGNIFHCEHTQTQECCKYNYYAFHTPNSSQTVTAI